MPVDHDIYTYRGNEKIELIKHTEKFVARTLPDYLKKHGFPFEKQLSSASTLIACNTEELEPMMAALRQSTVCHHLYATCDAPENYFLITDRLFLKFQEGATSTDMANLLEKYALEIVRTYEDGFYLVMLTNKTGRNPIKLVVELVEHQCDLLLEVDHDLNYITKKSSIYLPTDTSYLNQWHLHRRSPFGDVDSRASSNCEEAWKALGNFGNRNIVIGITDDGCDMNHQDFNAQGKFPYWAYLEGTSIKRKFDSGADARKMYHSGRNHGTACAGVAAAQINGLMTVGVAPNCSLVPIKWETSDDGRMFVSDSKFIEILNYVKDKVDILSNSWGDIPMNSRSPQVTTLIEQLTKTGGRRGKGIVFLWSAGNENCPIQHESDIEIPYSAGLYWVEGKAYWLIQKSKKFFNSFVFIKGVMLVGAISSKAKRSHYSNYGLGLDICAPSSNRHTYNRMDVDGRGITTTLGGNTTRTDFGGTSSATPLVAGIAALVLSANPELMASEVVEILKSTASKNLNMEGYAKTPHDPNWDVNERDWDISPVKPYDSGRFQNKGYAEGTWSPWFGFGKADAQAAVKEAIRRRPRIQRPRIGKTRFLKFRPYTLSGIAHFDRRGSVAIKNGLVLGNVLVGQKLTGLSLNIEEFQPSISLSYEATFENGQRSGWVGEGQIVGAQTGPPKITALAIRLIGQKANLYNVNYRIISEGEGLSKLCRNGATCISPRNSDIVALFVSINEKN